jgi:hypothetical protein
MGAIARFYKGRPVTSVQFCFSRSVAASGAVCTWGSSAPSCKAMPATFCRSPARPPG